MTDRRPTLAVPLLAAAFLAAPMVAVACPFCKPIDKTLSEDINNAAVVAIAELTKTPPPVNLDAGDDILKVDFQIVELFKGDKHLRGQRKISNLFLFETATKGDRFLLFGNEPPELIWSKPIRLSPRAEKYVRQLPDLPETGERLVFFQQFLEDEDALLARDSYDEFATASYADLKSIRDKMDREQLLAWIQDEEITPSSRGLYLTMLGVCGNREDAKLLEKMLRGDDPAMKVRLDALVGCYLTLMGAEGLPVIEEVLLTDKDVEFTYVYSAINALRFHGEESDRIPRERIQKSMHLLLDRPELADLVIVDLARWEDWSVVDRLAELYKSATDETKYIRVPIARYLLKCPLPQAKEHLKELAKVDAKAIQRAKNFYFPRRPSPSSDTPESKKTSTPSDEPDSGKVIVAPTDDNEPAGTDAGPKSELTSTDPPSGGAQGSGDSVAKSDDAKPVADEDTSQATADTQDSEDQSEGIARSEIDPVKLSVVLPIVFGSGVLLFGVIWLLLRGPAAKE